MDNTRESQRWTANQRRPDFWQMIRWHWARGGWLDHLFMLWLVMPTLGMSALVWSRFFGSCVFAGFIDQEAGRVGCLVHPLRVGYPDCRKHAFPLIPTLGCNRSLLCPMLRTAVDLSTDFYITSKAGWKSLRNKVINP